MFDKWGLHLARSSPGMLKARETGPQRSALQSDESSGFASAKWHSPLHATNGIWSFMGFAVWSEFNLYTCFYGGVKPPA